MSFQDLLTAFTLPFVSRALITVLVLAVAAGVVGLFISFRDLEFVTDGLVHAVFPGLVVGYLMGGSAAILPGALVAGVIAAVLLVFVAKRNSVGHDAAIVVMLTSMFSLGIVLVSKQEGYVAQLESLLFGHLLTVTDIQLVSVTIVAALACSIIFCTWRAQLYRAIDETGFRAAGFHPLRTDLWLNIAVAMLVVAGVQALGNLMVLALLVVPMAAARQMTNRLGLLIPVAIVVSLVSGIMGLTASIWASFGFDRNASAGACVVLIMIAFYAIAAVARIAVKTWRSQPDAASETKPTPRDSVVDDCEVPQ